MNIARGRFKSSAETVRRLASVAANQPRSATSCRPSFPCVDRHEERQRKWLASASSSSSASSSKTPFPGPEPPYSRPSPFSYSIYHHTRPLDLVYGSTLPTLDIAYETWGDLNADKSNAILLHTGLSASSHAAATADNTADGWWQKFIGPGKALDTNKYFIICTNVLGGCYGSTGPSSVDPTTGEPYGTTFPVLSIHDMIRSQFHLLDHLRIKQLYASVGSSMGAMQSLAAGWLFPDRVGRVVSISGTARSSPSSIAMRFAQRSVLMADPNWNKGMYYGKVPPHTGMKLARQIATITYRSGPEWDQRFGRQFREQPDQEQNQVRVPALCPDFMIETYLDHQGEQFCLKYDANSLIYISKAMDLFDLTHSAMAELRLSPTSIDPIEDNSNGQLPHRVPPHFQDLVKGLAPLRKIPTLVLGVQSDILFPVDQQREVADALRLAGNKEVSYYELGGVWGHDTFLLDVRNVGGSVKGFLDRHRAFFRTSMRAVKGVLLTWSVFEEFGNNIELTNTKSDIAVKQILLAKNQQQNFMIEDLDDYHVLIKPEEEERVRRMLETELEKNTYSLDA